MNSNHNVSPSMQWFVLITFALCLLASVAFCIIALIVTKNPATLAISTPLLTPLLLAMRPIVRWIFPPNDKDSNKKQVAP